VLRAWWDSRGVAQDLPVEYLRVVQKPEVTPSSPFLVLLPSSPPQVQLVHTGVVAILSGSDQPISSEQLRQRLKLTAVPSLLANLGRIFAAGSVKSALLLTGSPGIGKTAVVEQAAALTGCICCRINFSANTSQAQLFGSMVPR
jgi:hypothetical protein